MNAALPGNRPGSQPFSCLLVEDDTSFARLLADVIEEEGGSVSICSGVAEARERVAPSRFDVLVLDNHLPDGKGFDLYREIAQRDPFQTVIAITGIPDLADAVELTRHGLFDYLAKPFSEASFAACVRRATLRQRFRNVELGEHEMTLCSPSMRPVAQALEEAARHRTATVLVTGETGAGKDLAARMLHKLTYRGTSPAAPFVPVNCASVPAEMFEAELFGSERGAYTGAIRSREGLVGAAQHGTLFLDEVGEVPLPLQAKLLRFLEAGEYRALGSSTAKEFTGRVVAATNKSLREEVARGRFREDLLYRLDVVRIHLPPLRERREEIPVIAERLLEQLAAKYQRQAPRVKPEDMRALTEYGYPGNVRELRNLLERSLLRTPPDVSWLSLDLTWLKEAPPFARSELSAAPASPAATVPQASPIPHDLNPMEASEYEVIRKALLEARGGIRRAASKLGISHQVILRRLQKWPELRNAGREQE